MTCSLREQNVELIGLEPLTGNPRFRTGDIYLCPNNIFTQRIQGQFDFWNFWHCYITFVWWFTVKLDLTSSSAGTIIWYSRVCPTSTTWMTAILSSLTWRHTVIQRCGRRPRSPMVLCNVYNIHKWRSKDKNDAHSVSVCFGPKWALVTLEWPTRQGTPLSVILLLKRLLTHIRDDIDTLQRACNITWSTTINMIHV